MYSFFLFYNFKTFFMLENINISSPLFWEGKIYTKIEALSIQHYLMILVFWPKRTKICFFARTEKEPVKNERSTIFEQYLLNISTIAPILKAQIRSFLEFYLFLIIAVIFSLNGL